MPSAWLFSWLTVTLLSFSSSFSSARPHVLERRLVHRVHRRVHHGRGRLEVRQRQRLRQLLQRVVHVGDERVAEEDLGVVAAAEDDVPHVARVELAHGHGEGEQQTQLHHLVRLVRVVQEDAVAALHDAVLHLNGADDSLVGVVPAVADAGAEGIAATALRPDDAVHDAREDVRNADVLLGGAAENGVFLHAHDLHDLLLAVVDVCVRKVDFRYYRNDIQVVLHRTAICRQRLCLDSLRGIDEHEDALAGGKTLLHLVRKVHVTRRVDQIQEVVLVVLRRAHEHARRLRLHGDASLALHLQIVQKLRLRILRNVARVLHDRIG